MDTYDWITFLPMSDGGGAYNRYFGRLVGIVAKLDVVRGIYEEQPRMLVKEILSSKLIVTYPDESLFNAMNKMIINHISQLPVVKRNNPDQLLGLLALDDITRIQCASSADAY